MIVVLRVGTLPDPDLIADLDLSPDELVDERSPSQVAADIPDDNASDRDVVVFWEKFGCSLVKSCRPKNPADAVAAAVRSICAEVICEDELKYDRTRLSPEIDLDHWSGPGFLG